MLPSLQKQYRRQESRRKATEEWSLPSRDEVPDGEEEGKAGSSELVYGLDPHDVTGTRLTKDG